MSILRKIGRRSGLVIGLLGLLVSPAVLADTLSFTRMLSSGGTTPDGSGTFLYFGSPSYSNGQLAFNGYGAGFGSGIFTTDGTATYKIADTSTLYPGRSDPFIDFVGSPVISNGQVAFISRYGATTGESGLFTAPFAGGSLQVLADGTTPVPGGSGFLAPFFQPSFSDGQAVFWNRGTNDASEGIYLAGPGGVSVLANFSTPVPGGGTFKSFGFTPSISGSSVAFLASTGLSSDGTIYLAAGGVLRSIVSLATNIPGGTGAFTSLLDPVLSGQNLAFLCQGADGQRGLYAWVNGALRVIADLQTQVPGGSNLFTDFSSVSISSEGLVFTAFDTGNTLGIYYSNFETGLLTRVIASGDRFEGGVVALPLLGPQALDGGEFAFRVIFQDGANSLYVASLSSNAIPEPGTLVLSLMGLPCLGVIASAARWGRGRRGECCAAGGDPS